MNNREYRNKKKKNNSVFEDDSIQENEKKIKRVSECKSNVKKMSMKERK